ncbi:MAG TPA: hypothetical protein PK875_08155, partial [Spirochaetota bacterium]|nr:hypothetical protein [Spirochaetota bacterium]
MKRDGKRNKKDRTKQVKRPRLKRIPKTQTKKSLLFENLLINISTKFISLPADKIDNEIRSAQKEICAFWDIDCCALWQISSHNPEDIFLTHWYAMPEFRVESPENINGKEYFPWSWEKVSNNSIVSMSSIKDAPKEAV